MTATVRRRSSEQAFIERAITRSHRRPAPIGTLRLRLKPAHQRCGFVQGAWWPRSTVLGTELPPLLAVIRFRFGAVDRVRYHAGDWSGNRIQADDAVVVDGSSPSPHVVSLSGPDFGKITLLVVPPYTEPTQAYDIVVTASSVHDSSTPEQLLTHTTQGAGSTPAPAARIETWNAPPQPVR